jgi:hypothetical protein
MPLIMTLLWKLCCLSRRGEDPIKKPQQQKKWWSKVDTHKEETIREVHQYLSQKARRVSINVGSVENPGISRRIAGKDRMHPRKTPQKKKRKLI